MSAFAAVIATQLTDHSARSKRLCFDGQDMLLSDRTATANRAGIPLETITVTEQGPGGVSSLSCSIDDPLIAVQLAEGQAVEYWDITRDRPLFLGFIQALSIYPQGTGRRIDVTCVGIEALLDWMIVPACTIPAGTWMAAAIQSLVYQATGVGWTLRAFTQPSGLEDYGSQPYPIAGLFPGFPATTDVVSVDGVTLREACLQVIDTCNTWYTGTGAAVTIDFYSGVRLFNVNGPSPSSSVITISAQSDMATMHIDNNPVPGAGYLSTQGLNVHLDQGGITRGVYIQGANAAGTGLVSDGSGVPGPVATMSEPASNSIALKNAFGLAYLAGFSQSARIAAPFDPIDKTVIDTDNYRPGSYVWFQPDGQTFANATLFTLMAITKTFHGGNQESWLLDIGGLAPSAAKQLRRLTRGTRS